MSKVIPINSQAHFKSTLASTTYLVVDFYVSRDLYMTIHPI